MAAATQTSSTLDVSLSASVSSPAPVGTIVTWTATVGGGSPANVWYRFRARDLRTVLGSCPAIPGVPARHRCGAAADFSIIRDYGPLNTLDWTESEHEGDYEVEISARDTVTGAVGVATALFQFTPRVSGDTPAVSQTVNPLVLLYSAPACPAGNTMRVQFQSPDGFVQSTNSKPCDSATTMNFYLAGMRAETVYSIQHIVESGSHAVTGPVLKQATQKATGSFGPYSVVNPPATPIVNPIVLHSRFGAPAATDWLGNVVWYYPVGITTISRPEPGGLFLGWFEGQTFDTAHQILREFDLAGTTIRETNAARVSEQLVSLGMHPITSFHHEVRSLPDGGILALASTERILTDIQGPGPVDVIGDMIVALDRNLQVRWAWDAFDHLDQRRAATLNEVCTPTEGGCPPLRLASLAKDWTHGNSLELTSDGNLLYSARHQDWVMRIDYRNGLGTGGILWHLGRDGDFQFRSGDPYPWFSHQHDANMDSGGLLTVFDNGNVRNATDASAHSRGQAIQIDEQNHTATLVANIDLGDFSMALGSAQRLPNGNYYFHLGYITTTNTSRAVEVDASGRIVYDMHIGELEYRSFRMSSLYGP